MHATCAACVHCACTRHALHRVSPTQEIHHPLGMHMHPHVFPTKQAAESRGGRLDQTTNGRVVRIKLLETNFLSLPEVQVWARGTVRPAKDRTRLGPRRSRKPTWAKQRRT